MAVASLVAVTGLQALASSKLEVKGFNLTQLGDHVYDANPSGDKTEAQKAVDYIYELGGRHIVLIPEARMESVTGSAIVPQTPIGGERAKERARYIRLMKYITSKGMTVGIRPIILVDAKGKKSKDDWHGNIRPENPAAWFESLRSYLDIYINIAKAGGASEFTVAAELYSMVMGLDDAKIWKERFGFPREWLQLVRDVKAKIPGVRIMIDINYTDVAANKDGTGGTGGELERWRARLADANTKAKDLKGWEVVRDLWKEIDVIGIDIYRSFLTKGQEVPKTFEPLVAAMTKRGDQFSGDIDNKLAEIETAVGFPKKIIVKEVGFKSCTNCFIDSYEYDDAAKEPNVLHQATAFQTFFDSFVKADWPWMMGVTFWDVAVDPARSGVKDPGFSPRGKKQTEDVIKKSW